MIQHPLNGHFPNLWKITQLNKSWK